MAETKKDISGLDNETEGEFIGIGILNVNARFIYTVVSLSV